MNWTAALPSGSIPMYGMYSEGGGGGNRQNGGHGSNGGNGSGHGGNGLGGGNGGGNGGNGDGGNGGNAASSYSAATWPLAFIDIPGSATPTQRRKGKSPAVLDTNSGYWPQVPVHIREEIYCMRLLHL